MNTFINLKEILHAVETDPATANDPIKRMFLCDGGFITANISIIEDSSNLLHTQRDHDELLVILEGESDFRVGQETRRVREGDMIFIPRNTIHGPVVSEGERLGVLSVFAPFFDRGKKNIEWARDLEQ